ncbi:MAG: hypothetical protein ACRELF_28000 [Gemmataceae bacterium]
MKRHKFTLILSSVSELTPDLADALYEATGGDIEFSLRDGQAILEFDRTGAALADAIRSAIAQVQSADATIRVARVELTESGR